MVNCATTWALHVFYSKILTTVLVVMGQSCELRVKVNGPKHPWTRSLKNQILASNRQIISLGKSSVYLQPEKTGLPNFKCDLGL